MIDKYLQLRNRLWFQWLGKKCGWMHKRYLSWLFFVISKDNVEFPYHGDTVIYRFPWERRGMDNRPFISLSFEGNFHSLKELDKQWDEYFLACQEANVRDKKNPIDWSFE